MKSNDKKVPELSPLAPTSEAILRGQIAARPFFCPARRAIARSAGFKVYDDYCDTHGVTHHRASSGACEQCAMPRAAARRRGETTYLASCACSPEPTAHSVLRGKCLTCYTQDGLRRAGTPGRPLKYDARSIARREGRKTYQAGCSLHGVAAHSVAVGKCLTCFTHGGFPRAIRAPKPASAPAVKPPQARNPRAEARRRGVTTYAGQCPTHGETPHSVQHGKCLRCYTTAGARRKRLDGAVAALLRRVAAGEMSDALALDARGLLATQPNTDAILALFSADPHTTPE